MKFSFLLDFIKKVCSKESKFNNLHKVIHKGKTKTTKKRKEKKFKFHTRDENEHLAIQIPITSLRQNTKLSNKLKKNYREEKTVPEEAAMGNQASELGQQAKLRLWFPMTS